MKKYRTNIFRLALVLLIFSACSPEDWTSPSEGDIPSASDINATITTDQSINQVTFSIDNAGCYPIWIFDGEEYSTTNGLSKIYSTYGTYEVEIKIGNANGISDGSITESFTFDNSVIDHDSFITRMAGDSSKEWVIASEEVGHISYGETGTDGTGEFSATAYEYNGMGIYDDVVTFYTDSTYKYDPGDGGTVLVNSGCTIFSDYQTSDGDYMVPVDAQTATYSFSADEDDVYLELPAETLFPYIPYDDSYYTPKFKIVSLTTSQMELIADNGSIAWHFILVSQSSLDSENEGYDPDSECNLWTDASFDNTYYYAPGWTAIDDPEMTQDGNSYTFSLPTATSDQWQAQCFFNTNIATNSSTNYDFSCKLYSTTDISNVTVKLFKHGDNDTYYFVDNISLDAYEGTYVVHTNMTGFDADSLSLVLDFGGNPENTEVTVSDIVVKENSCDDGTVIDDDSDDIDWNEDSSCNLWNDVTFTNSYYYAPGWTAIDDPEMTQDGNSYTFSLPTATTDQWQAQCFFETDISTSADVNYDFRCVLNSTTSISSVTIKLYKNGDDDTYFFSKVVSLTAYEDYEFEMTDMEGFDADNINLVFDFGGNPADTEVTVSGIIFKDSSCTD